MRRILDTGARKLDFYFRESQAEIRIEEIVKNFLHANTKRFSQYHYEIGYYDLYYNIYMGTSKVYCILDVNNEIDI